MKMPEGIYYSFGSKTNSKGKSVAKGLVMAWQAYAVVVSATKEEKIEKDIPLDFSDDFSL